MQTAQALIPVFTGSINDEQAQLVDARTLHRFLGIDTEFRKWVSRRIEEYGFQEGEDFRSFLGESSGGRRGREYHVTLDMGKELAMVERNDKGRQARRYFIECEKRLQQVAPQDADDIRARFIGVTELTALKGLIRDKAKVVPLEKRRGFQQTMCNRLHTRFNVPRIELIPAPQFEAACNFVAAYAMEGEWLPKEEPAGTLLSDSQLYDVYLVCHHFDCLHEIFKRHDLYTHLTGLGSRAGIEMIDHFKDGSTGTWKLKKEFGSEFDAVQQRRKLNQYSPRHTPR